jgi:hypothetical protein
MVGRAVRLIATLALLVIVVAGVAWAAMALCFDGPESGVLAATMAGGLALVSIHLAAMVRPFLRGLALALLPVASVALWWMSVPPSNARDWAPDVARTARATFDGSRVTIENVRNFKYRSESDYDQRLGDADLQSRRHSRRGLVPVVLGTAPNRAYHRELGLR